MKNRMSGDEFKQRVFKWADVIDVEPNQVHIRNMCNKWASLSQNGRLTFNNDLLSKHRNFSDYVIVHELLHMKVPNHGKLFKSLLYAYLPDWEKASKLEQMDIK